MSGGSCTVVYVVTVVTVCLVAGPSVNWPMVELWGGIMEVVVVVVVEVSWVLFSPVGVPGAVDRAASGLETPKPMLLAMAWWSRVGREIGGG